MKVTKYEHACLLIEKNDKKIVIDPGIFTKDFTTPDQVVAVIITHEHGDHIDHEILASIVASNPQVIIIGPEHVTKTVDTIKTHTIHGGDTYTIEGFDLRFYGDTHALIHPDIQVVQNVGVLIEDRLYYPGDSLTIPDVPIDTLALPVSAPWLKISEAVDFMRVVSARFTFPTHDAILSPAGKKIVDTILGSFAASANTEYRRVSGEMIDL